MARSGGRRIAIHADHVLETTSTGAIRPRSLPSIVLIENDRIVAVTSETAELDAEHVRLPPGGVLLPGLIDTHTHSLNGPLFRSTTEDRSRGGDQSLVYDYLMPVGDLASRLLSPTEARDVYTAALTRTLLQGTTTVLDVFRPDSSAFIEAAEDVGLRAFAAPYAASSSVAGLDAAADPIFVARDEDAEVAVSERIHADHDGSGGGRIRIAFGPHCTDTCSPALLRRFKRRADRTGALLTIHAAQSQTEVRWMQQRLGMSPIEYLAAHGIVGRGVILAHAVFATDEDLALLAETSTTVAVCPATFAQGGHHVNFRRFVSAGVPTTLGTDGYSVSLLGDLRLAGVLAKTATADGDVATASELLELATTRGGAALDGPPIGHLRPGATADIVGLSFDPHRTGPVLDPLRTLVWHADAARVEAVFVDGEPVVRDGTSSRIDLPAVGQRATDAIARVWREAEERLGLSPTTGLHPAPGHGRVV